MPTLQMSSRRRSPAELARITGCHRDRSADSSHASTAWVRRGRSDGSRPIRAAWGNVARTLRAVETALRDTVGEALGSDVQRAVLLGGGDVARSYRVDLDDGRTVFAKAHADPPPGCFVTEASGLLWLRAADAVAVPEVLAVGDGGAPDGDGPVAFLALEWVEEGRRGGDDRELGVGLARLHQAGAPSFGREDRRPTGSRSLPNAPTATWAEFYRERRLVPLVRLARDGRAVDDRVLSEVEVLAGRLEGIGAADEPPARLHGDLWAGNRLVDRHGRNWLIDPAAHGGHREFDLAMMRLFGGFGAGAFAAYAEVSPLADGWEDRVPLHQLAPLLVHAIKFGGSYPAAVGRAVAAARRLA
jgi:fructosamine-3-kinase